MSQFDVHRNPGKNQAAIPYVVVVQSAAFDKLARRLVIPLLAEGAGERFRIPYSDTTPSLIVDGQRLLLNPFELVSVEASKLGPPVASLFDSGDVIVAAMEEVFSRAFG